MDARAACGCLPDAEAAEAGAAGRDGCDAPQADGGGRPQDRRPPRNTTLEEAPHRAIPRGGSPTSAPTLDKTMLEHGPPTQASSLTTVRSPHSIAVGRRITAPPAGAE